MRFFLVFVLFLPSLASALPALEETELYTNKTTDCHDVDLSTWRHPIRAVFKKANITLERVQLCNGDRYPIFTVELPYDPTGETKSYFTQLYWKIRKANGKWPYAIVATSDNLVLYISYSVHDTLVIDYEQYHL